MNQSEDNTSVSLTNPNDRQYQLDDKVHTTSNTGATARSPNRAAYTPRHYQTLRYHLRSEQQRPWLEHVVETGLSHP
jgi:hypothetical protein